MKTGFKCFVIISVLFNILLLATCAGHISRHFISPPPIRELADVATLLPEDKRVFFLDAIRRADKDTAPLHDRLNNARMQINIAYQKEPFDKQAYLAALQSSYDIAEAIKGRMGDVMVELASQLTPQERAIVSEQILKHRGLLIRSHAEVEEQLKANQ